MKGEKMYYLALSVKKIKSILLEKLTVSDQLIKSLFVNKDFSTKFAYVLQP